MDATVTTFKYASANEYHHSYLFLQADKLNLPVKLWLCILCILCLLCRFLATNWRTVPQVYCRTKTQTSNFAHLFPKYIFWILYTNKT